MNNERMIAVSSDLIERAISLIDLLPESGTIIELRAALATQPAAGEPVYQIRQRNEGYWKNCGPNSYEAAKNCPSVETRILWTAPPAAAHGDEAVRKNATESAIQRACRELPEGWSMQIELERGAGDVTLFNAWDIVVDFGQDFESSISEQVDAAIDAAMRAQGDGGQV